MRILVLVFASLFAIGQGAAQTPCDTLKIKADMLRSRELLNGGQIQPAIELAQAALHALADCPADSALREKALGQLAGCHQTAAVDYMQRNRLNLSIDASERNIALIRQLPGNNTDRLAAAYLDLAKAHGLNENRKIAIEKSLKGLEIRQSANPADPKIAAHLSNLVDHYLVLGDTANAGLYLRQWNALMGRPGMKTSLQARVNYTNTLAFYYYQKGEVTTGIRILEDTLARYGEQVRAKGGIIGTGEYTLSQFYAVVGNYEKSLFYAEKNVALFELRLKQQRGKLFSRSHYAWCLAQSAKAAWGLYVERGDTSWYHLAERRCGQAEDMFFAIRDRSPNDGFREWVNDRTDIVGNLTEVRQGLYARTGDRKHVERAFETLEASKTFAIQQFLHETYALQWGGLPDSLYQRESAYRQQVNDLETNFFMVRSRPDADSLIAANDQKLFALRDRYSVFLAGLEQNYPEYFRLKYSHPDVNLDQVQTRLLRPGQCLLDLYVRNNQVLAMLIRPDTIVWLVTPFDSTGERALETLETESRRFAEYQHLPEAQYLQRLQTYAEAAHRGYQMLIEPLRPVLTEEVVLIPRNELVALPFGALLTQRETELGKPFLWHYLDQELVISQAFSAGLFQFVQNRPVAAKPAGTLLAFAPFFEGKIAPELDLPVGDAAQHTRNEIFQPLPNSGEEALAIAKMSAGRSLLGPKATKTSFLQQSPGFNILHLATHSAANDVLGEYSFVALQADSTPQKIDLLYARDIYGLRLSADLVVLSACETALGQYRWGEGIVGLTRAFNCAGVRNVVASLWSVHDGSTKELMIHFYREIQQGAPYNRALALAKRAFIRENRQQAHPYYWAGFVLNGR